MDELRPGAVVDGRYLIERRVGRGGMGRVYLGRHRYLRRSVAIKVLHQHLLEEPHVIRRFTAEARAACTVDSPGVVRVYDFGKLPIGAPYYVMEYLDGELLSHYVGRHAPSLEELLDFSTQIADALASIHEAGIIHRDLKLSNVMLIARGLERHVCKVFDFGLARSQRYPQRLTPTGRVCGTPGYMAPEQCLGRTADYRTDIYAFGVVLFAMATGQLPFEGEGLDVMRRTVQESPPHPVSLASGESFPPELSSLIRACMERKPSERARSMRDVREMLLELQLRTTARPTLRRPPLESTEPTASWPAESSSEELTPL